MKKILIALMMMSLSTGAIAEPISIKGLEIGMDKKEAKKQIKEIRIKSKWMNAKLFKHYYMTLAGLNVTLPKIWYDEDKKIEEMAWFICYSGDGCAMQGDAGHSPNSFKIIADAIVKKFDMECGTETLQNAFGATYENRVCYYHDGHGTTIKTERYYKDLTEGRISIYSTETFMANLKKIKTGTGDL